MVKKKVTRGWRKLEILEIIAHVHRRLAFDNETDEPKVTCFSKTQACVCIVTPGRLFFFFVFFFCFFFCGSIPSRFKAFFSLSRYVSVNVSKLELFASLSRDINKKKTPEDVTKNASATLAVFCDEREHETVSSFSDHFLGVYINRILCFLFS